MMPGPVFAPTPPTQPTRPKTKKAVLLFAVFVIPFFLITGGVLVYSEWLDSSRTWQPIAGDPIETYAPASMRLVHGGHSGWQTGSGCAPSTRCSVSRYFVGPKAVADAQAQVEGELVAMGYAYVKPVRAKCAPAKDNVRRFVKGELSVWVEARATPYTIGKSEVVGVAEGASVTWIEVDNFSVPWGC